MKKGIVISGRILKALGKVSDANSIISRYTGLYVIRDDKGTYIVATNGKALVAYRVGKGGSSVGGHFEYRDIQILGANEKYEIKITSRTVFINSPNVSILAADNAESMKNWKSAFALAAPKKGGQVSVRIPRWEDVRKVKDVFSAIIKGEGISDASIYPVRFNGSIEGSVSFVSNATLTRNGKHIQLDDEVMALIAPSHPMNQNRTAPSWAVADENDGF